VPVIRRIDKAYYRTGPQLRLWWPLNRSKRMWRAAHIHRKDYERYMIADWALSLLGLKEGETRNGVTCIASYPHEDVI
jgi:hypothetical protein